MTEYQILGTVAYIRRRETYRPRDGHITLGVPAGATVYVNGHALPASTGRVRVPKEFLHDCNTVRIKHDSGVSIGESFLWDGSSLTPRGYDNDVCLREVMTLLSSAITRISTLENILSRLQGEVESPLFL